MMDFGNTEERQAALRIAVACKELNSAIADASNLGVNVKIVDLAKHWDDPSQLQVDRMERRTMILPTALDGDGL
jgi:hypothetical protein